MLNLKNFRCNATVYKNVVKKPLRLLSSSTKIETPESTITTTTSTGKLPESADVVIIGGGSAGCNAFYHLTKRGVRAVLLERAKLTAGTTWHTAGLVWRLRPSDVEIQLLASTRNLLMSLEAETGLDPGWIMNGGLFISHSDERFDEYKRLATLGKCFGIESHVLSPEETQGIFPLLDPSSFTGALYSPGDGVVDPAMFCAALTRAATTNGGQYFEECPVEDLVVGENVFGVKDVRGVVTPHGTIRTNAVLNATGVWGRDIIEKHGIHLPLIPMRHAYIVSETIDGVRGMPNVRDHDYSLYFRIQGSSICMGGYENNPVLLDSVPKDFNFGLYELDWSLFDGHVGGSVKLCPAFGQAGIKSTVCGPESFTPDHKPLMGPDPRLDGLFHSCGYNSAGMMLGGGCGEQIAEWIIKGRPDRHMFGYDIRRFNTRQTRDTKWATERSHESYAKNYSIVFPHDQPLAGRNFTQDPLHNQMIQYGAIMEEKHGWERPGYFARKHRVDDEDEEIETVTVQPYDWYGFYGNEKNIDTSYEEKLRGDYKFGFSDHHNLIGEEAHLCRTNAVMFNLSYFCKLFLTGKQAKEAVEWIFTNDFNKPINKTVYTCALNHKGGVEADVTVTEIISGSGEQHDPIFKGQGYYIVAGGASAAHTVAHMNQMVRERGIVAKLTDVTEELGVISLQGPNSREILQKVTDFKLTDEALSFNSSTLADINVEGCKKNVRILRVSFVGELGYEIHVPKASCVAVYNAVMEAGQSTGLRNAGYRSLYALSSEKGYHLWGFDLRSDDTPIEANLGFVCRKSGDYVGKSVVEKQRHEGVFRKLAYFTLDEQIPLFGLETIYRNGEVVGHLRRGEYGYFLQKPIGQGYLKRPDGKLIDKEFIENGKYQIESLGRMYNATCHLRSPFDREGKRVLGIY